MSRLWLKSSILIGVILIGAGFGYAQTVDKATGGTSISADSVGGTFTTLAGPVITETTAGQIPLGNIIFKAPSGFEWDTSGTDPAVSIALAPGNNANTLLDIVFRSRTPTELTFEVIQASNSGPRKPGQATFSGFRVRPTSGIMPNSGIIKNVGNSGPAGLTNYGDLIMVAGAPSQVRVETAADGSGGVVPAQNLTAGESISVYSVSRDQHGNYLQNIAAETWSLVDITGGIVQGDLSVAGDSKSALLTGDLLGTAKIQAAVSGLTSVNSGVISVVPGPATTLALTTQPSDSAIAGTAFAKQPQLAIRDDYGNTVTGDNLTQVTASINTGSDNIQGTVTKKASAGIVTFTDLYYTTAEQIDILFSSSNLTSVISNTITVGPAAADSLIFNVQPTNTEKNTAISPPIEVQVVDQFGNSVGLSGSSIVLTETSGENFTDDSPQTTNSAGVAVFSGVSFSKTGTKRIRAIEENSLLDPSAPSNPFFISLSGELAKFSVTLASGDSIPGQTAGQSFYLKIAALDGAGDTLDGGPNRDNYQTTVTVSSDGDLLKGGGTSANFINGVLDSHEVAISNTGEFSITVTDTSGEISSSSNPFQVIAAAYDTTTSTIVADSSSLIANGTNTSRITITLKDQYGNILGRGNNTVTIETAGGTLLDTVANHEDGTYTQDLQSPTSVGSTTITASANGDSISSGNPVIQFVPGSLDHFLVESATGGSIPQQTAGQSFDIRITALDANTNTVTGFTGTVDLTSSATISSGGGTSPSFTDGVLANQTLIITSAGDYTITATNSAGNQAGQSNFFTVIPAGASALNSTITTARSFLQNNGADTTTVTVQLKDIYGNNLITGGDVVTLNNTAGSLVNAGATVDQGDGTYTDRLVSSTNIETAIITGTVNGDSIADQARVEITKFNEWTSGGGGPNASDWELAGNWSIGTLPTTGEVIVIPTNPQNGSSYPVIDTSDPVLDFLLVDAGATTLTQPGRTIVINNDVTGDGTLIVDDGSLTIGGDISISQLNAGNSTVTLNGTSGQAITGPLTTDTLSIQTAGTVTATSYLDAFSLLSIPNTTLTMESGSELVLFNDIDGAGMLVGNNSLITFGGEISGSLSINISTSSVLLNGTAQQSFSNISQVKDLTIDNAAGVVADTDLTVTQTLKLTDGVLTMPSGRNLIANTKTVIAGSLRFEREIAGAQGWRLLSSPLATTYGDLLGNIFTQGYTGADSVNGSPSVLYYDETYPGTENQRWRKPNADTDMLSPGVGYFVYFFGNIDTVAAYSDPLPDTLDVTGLEHEGNGVEFDFGVTFTTAENTDTIYTAVTDTGWNLIGNPFGASIDWDDAGDWTKTNIDSTIYVWDANADSAQYRLWNGEVGNLGTGVIAPFQGFWVKANAPNPVLKVEKEAKTTGGVFYKPAGPPSHIKLHLEADGLSSGAFFMFSDEGKTGRDAKDGYYLEPPTDTFIALFSENNTGAPLQINTLPMDIQKRQRIPVWIGGFRNGQAINKTYTIRWPRIANIPKSWTISLYDRTKNRIIDLGEQSSYTFDHKSSLAKPSVVTQSKLALLQQPAPNLAKAGASRARFELLIDPYGNDPNIPATYVLEANYPNPFNEATTIRFGLPELAEVQIDIYDITGRLVTNLRNKEYPAGYHDVTWNAAGNASGIYFLTLRTGGKRMTQKMILLK